MFLLLPSLRGESHKCSTVGGDGKVGHVNEFVPVSIEYRISTLHSVDFLQVKTIQTIHISCQSSLFAELNVFTV